MKLSLKNLIDLELIRKFDMLKIEYRPPYFELRHSLKLSVQKNKFNLPFPHRLLYLPTSHLISYRSLTSKDQNRYLHLIT